MSKTVLQLANEIGIPKQRLYRYIKNHITDVHQIDGVMYIDDAVESLIKSQLLKDNTSSDVHHEAHHDAVTDAVVEMLRKELEVKNEQIKSLNERLAETTAALLTAQQTAQVAQALHAGTIRQQIGDSEGEPTEPKKSGFFDRFWRKQ